MRRGDFLLQTCARQAATTGNVVLMTREFGRGTDFVCYDDDLDIAGGVLTPSCLPLLLATKSERHQVLVIQTFVSEIKSEETQIKVPT